MGTDEITPNRASNQSALSASASTCKGALHPAGTYPTVFNTNAQVKSLLWYMFNRSVRYVKNSMIDQGFHDVQSDLVYRYNCSSPIHTYTRTWQSIYRYLLSTTCTPARAVQVTSHRVPLVCVFVSFTERSSAWPLWCPLTHSYFQLLGLHVPCPSSPTFI